MSDHQQIDVAIVGGGIVGLWCAYQILKKRPALSVAVFESNLYLGEHTTSRSSEVLHAGIYYPTGSRKHVHCLRGNQLWREYVALKNLPFLDCGKIIAATQDQKEKLEKLYAQSQKNDVPGIRVLTQSEVSNLQTNLNIDLGFYSPSSGVLNIAGALKSLRQDIETMGGIVLTKSEVKINEFAPEKFVFDVNGDKIQSPLLINAAGLFALAFREGLNLTGYENFFVKGSYLRLGKKLSLDKLIYPVPPADGLGLGVHLTLDTSGDQKFGPDTVPVSAIEYSVDDSLVEKMAPAINQVFKNVKTENLQLAYCGIRPKIKKAGVLVTDFLVQTDLEHGLKGYFEFLGIDSPGITAAPSLGALLADRI